MSRYCLGGAQLQRRNDQEHIAESLDQAAILTMRNILDRAGLTATAYPDGSQTRLLPLSTPEHRQRILARVMGDATRLHRRGSFSPGQR
jgi:hypothetical protein